MNVLPSVAALLLSMAVMVIGHGLQQTLLPLHATSLGWADSAIGVFGSAYFLGFLLGCLLAPRVVQRAGHIRSFAALAALVGAVAQAHYLLADATLWVLLRLISGAGVAGLYTVIESWLNERATEETRGQLLSLYVVINLSVMTIGQLIINVAPVAGPTLFMLASMLIILSIVPVSMTLAPQPGNLAVVQVRMRRLVRNTPVAFVAVFCSGVVTGAFWSLAPVYASASSGDIADVSWLMSVVIVGGAVLQYPLGRLSDHHDRRWTILAVLIGIVLASALLVLVDSRVTWIDRGLYFLWGGFALSLYALCLAHANDLTHDTSFVEVGTGVLVAWGTGAVVGPLWASALMSRLGPDGLFWSSLVAALVGAIFTGWRLLRVNRPASTIDFVSVPRGSPTAFHLDPRSGAPSSDEQV